MAALQPLPKWAPRSLQALAYWIGWSHERYPHWPLSEGAMVAEAQALIASFAPCEMAVMAEVQVSELLNEKNVDVRSGRVDLVIAKRENGRRPARSQLLNTASELIEVKRAQTPWSEIERDLVRLARLLHHSLVARRAFLILGCEAGKVPSPRFVKEGLAIRKQGEFSGGTFRTRRVWAVSPSRGRTRTAHIVTVVEVFTQPSQNEK